MKPKFKKLKVGDYLIVFGKYQDGDIVVPYKVIKCEQDQAPRCSCLFSENHGLLTFQLITRNHTAKLHYHFCPRLGLDWAPGEFHPKYFVVNQGFFKKYCEYLNLFYDREYSWDIQ